MSDNPREEVQRLIEEVGENLKPLGFRRKGPTFRMVRNNMCGVIQFQFSTKCDESQVVFAINVGVVCGDLLERRVKFTASRAMDAHLRMRLSELGPAGEEEWWRMDRRTMPGNLSNSIHSRIREEAVPFIERYMTPEAMIAFWEAGGNRGLTQRTRDDNLARLKENRRLRVPLLGAWTRNRTDADSWSERGCEGLEFRHSGEMVVRIGGARRRKATSCRFWVFGQSIATDLPILSRTGLSKFSVDNGVELSVETDGEKATFARGS